MLVYIISLLLLGLFGSWLVHQANRHLELSRTCRYRDFHRLIQTADRYSVSYVLTGLTAWLWYPIGAFVSLWVFGYAAYRRLR